MEEVQKSEKISQEQIHTLLFGEKLSWQTIIYDLINTEQLDPWDIDLSLLANKYLEKIRILEEAIFFVSSKVLLAAALLLRIKSEILLEQDIRSLDDILFGKKEEKKYTQERISLDEEIPDLVPRTPLPRFKKVTLQELMAALGKAITTETRRIKKVVLIKQQELETALSLPKQRVNLQEKIKEVLSKIQQIFYKRDTKLAFSELSGNSAEERISHFIPLLHLDYQHKVLLEQEGHLEEIYIWLKNLYEHKHAAILEQMRKDVELAMAEFEQRNKSEAEQAALEMEEEKEEEEEKAKIKEAHEMEEDLIEIEETE